MSGGQRINVLLGGQNSINTVGLFAPLKRYRTELKELGCEIFFFNSICEDLVECDTLVLDSKFFKDSWKASRVDSLEVIDRLRQKVENLFWFNTADSTTGIQTDVLPLVKKYIKAQALKKRINYKEALYGQRIFTHRCFIDKGITDASPAYSSPVKCDADLKKIVVGWNYGLAGGFNRIFDINRVIPLFGGDRFGMWSRMTLPRLSTFFVDPKGPRPNEIFAHMNGYYPRETITYQRQQSLSSLLDLSDLSVLSGACSRRNYFRRLRRSQIGLSPFGWGEINVRDFEIFAAGALLFKQNVSHIDTFPNYFIENETYIPYCWDASDLVEQIEKIHAQISTREELAENGQQLFRFYEENIDGKQAVIDHVRKVLT
jgi:hypothetical protein